MFLFASLFTTWWISPPPIVPGTAYDANGTAIVVGDTVKIVATITSLNFGPYPAVAVVQAIHPGPAPPIIPALQVVATELIKGS